MNSTKTRAIFVSARVGQNGKLVCLWRNFCALIVKKQQFGTLHERPLKSSRIRSKIWLCSKKHKVHKATNSQII